MAQNDKGLLLRLKEERVDFVIIGGVCGVLHGISLVTFDLDICCPFSKVNLQRIESALRPLDPRHRIASGRPRLELTDELCSRLKNLYLQTNEGILDCLSEVAGLGTYEKVLENSQIQEMSYGDFRILTLDALIIAKEAVGRERDLAAARQLRGIRERSKHQKPG